MARYEENQAMMRQYGNEARQFLKGIMLLWVHAFMVKFLCNVFEGKPKNKRILAPWSQRHLSYLRHMCVMTANRERKIWKEG